MEKLRPEEVDHIVEIDKAYTRCFSTDDGQTVLNDLTRKTLGRACWNPGDSHDIGYWREGQNDIVRFIFQRKERGEIE